MKSVPQPLALESIAAFQASGRLCLFTSSPRQSSQRLSMARYATGTATEIRPPAGFEPSRNQHLPAGSLTALSGGFDDSLEINFKYTDLPSLNNKLKTL